MVEEAGSGVAERESVNEYREKMMSKAIARVCTLSREEYEKKVSVFYDCGSQFSVHSMKENFS